MGELTMNNQSNQSVRSIIPPDLAIKAMRDNGFKNTAFAIAEIIDNSIQAEAKNIEVFCIEETTVRNGREVSRINAIGVLDNGTGMNTETLGLALQFGNGTHLSDRSGIGRFGMGLPNSSISQCRRVEVWTWTNSHENSIYSYLDIDEIERKELVEVPDPVQMQIPSEYLKFAESLGGKGTLVLWTKIDELRLSWKGAQTTLKHTENIIGRMYRKFIYSGEISIRMLAISDGEVTFDELARPNDPMYLMEGTSTPEPFSDNAMFRSWGDADGYNFKYLIDGISSVVTVRLSFASEETLTEDGTDRGTQPYGKHASKNVGVSIVREGRELELDNGWAESDPRERWWGVEVEFPSTLDEFFGVTNNKQSATIFSQMAKYEWMEEREENERFEHFIDRLKDQGDPRAILLEISTYIKNQLSQIRKKIREQSAGRRGGGGRRDFDNEDYITGKFIERSESGHESDVDKITPEEDDREDIVNTLVNDKNLSEPDAKRVADVILEREQKVKFLSRHFSSSAFFSVEGIPGGVTTIEFNMNHPLYEQLIASLNLEEENANNSDSDREIELSSRISRASDTLELLFAAWARFELEEVGYNDDRFLEFREGWGKITKDFLPERENGN